MATVAASSPATQPPLDVLADESFHQFDPMALEKAANRLLRHFGSTLEPPFLDERIDFAVELIGNLGLNEFHDLRLTTTVGQWAPESQLIPNQVDYTQCLRVE